MISWISDWKNRLFLWREAASDPEYTDLAIKGRTEANRYLAYMSIFFMTVISALTVLSICGVIPTGSPGWTYALLGVALLCHGAVVAVGFISRFSGRRTPVVLMSLVFVSFAALGLWVGQHVCFLFALPIFLSARYYDTRFSAVISGISLLSSGAVTFLRSFLWGRMTMTVYATAEDRLRECFDEPFFIGIALLAVAGVAAVSGAVGGRKMIREEAEIYAAQTKNELEISEAKTQIMLSQIQPHFIYNTLNIICYLCGKEPETAQNALSDFSDYLRENLNFSGKAELIPFDRELAHVQKYLSLEKMRFEDELNVETDIACTSFRIPALSVQPLVENAVKHGICHRDGGGTVKIQTKETMDHYVIVISDDGVGFDPEAPLSSNRRHIGLENTKSRLEKMCHATLTVESAIGEGTTITISVPKEYYYDNSRG